MTDAPPRSTSPTLEMVAAHAGVSRATVSRVVNGSTLVKRDVAALVTASIDALGYVPNRAARMLASRKTNSIALVIPENARKFFADPYFASVIEGVTTYLASTDYTLTLVIASETETEKTRRYLSGGNIDGALILSHHSDDRSWVELARNLPMVFAGRPINEGADNSYIVDVDNVAAAETATHYLLDRGRSHVATIAGPQDMAAGVDRVDGWRRAVESRGFSADLVEYGDFTPRGGADAMERLIARARGEFDSVFVASAQMAFGALGVLKEHGLDVPGSVAITTIDNDHYSENATPPLTTIEQPAVEQGSRIAETLVRLLAGEDVPKVTIMPTRLVERESA
ncbi:MAG: LacI family DNA-binding transcriptional regulator [Microbacteriaceae bacterium]